MTDILDTLSPEDYIDRQPVIEVDSLDAFRENFFSRNYDFVINIIISRDSYDHQEYFGFDYVDLMNFIRRKTTLIADNFFPDYMMVSAYDSSVKLYKSLENIPGCYAEPIILDFNEAGIICPMGTGYPFGLKLAIKNPTNLNNFIKAIYAIEDMLMGISSVFLKDIQIFSKYNIKNMMKHYLYKTGDLHFRLPNYNYFKDNIDPFIISKTNIDIMPNGVANFTSKALEITKTIKRVGLFQDINNLDLWKDVSLAMIAYIYRHRDRLEHLFIKKV